MALISSLTHHPLKLMQPLVLMKLQTSNMTKKGACVILIGRSIGCRLRRAEGLKTATTCRCSSGLLDEKQTTRQILLPHDAVHAPRTTVYIDVTILDVSIKLACLMHVWRIYENHSVTILLQDAKKTREEGPIEHLHISQVEYHGDWWVNIDHLRARSATFDARHIQHQVLIREDADIWVQGLVNGSSSIWPIEAH
eukprot:3528272-Amphidinium_carterae.1